MNKPLRQPLKQKKASGPLANFSAADIASAQKDFAVRQQAVEGRLDNKNGGPSRSNVML